LHRRVRTSAVTFQFSSNKIRFRRDAFLHARPIVRDEGVQPAEEVARHGGLNFREADPIECVRGVQRNSLSRCTRVGFGGAHSGVSTRDPRSSLIQELERQRYGGHCLTFQFGKRAAPGKRRLVD
jgi:hypothetical protein